MARQRCERCGEFTRRGLTETLKLVGPHDAADGDCYESICADCFAAAEYDARWEEE